MAPLQTELSDTFTRFIDSEKSSGIILIICTVIAILLANSSLAGFYLAVLEAKVWGLSIQHWINDGLMAIFFLLVGLELERELYQGELSEVRKALLPTAAALGGLVTPAVIHFAVNAGTEAQRGVGIPMATDIAFALAALSLIGSRLPAALKVFVVAFAVIDDLCAVVIIAAFYSADLSLAYLVAALAVWGVLVLLNRYFRIMAQLPYLLGGGLMWLLMLKSGVHATIAGVLLAFSIPFTSRDWDVDSPSLRLEHFLHKPVAFVILPLFALANTGVVISPGWTEQLWSRNSAGIIAGLVVGKAVGISTVSYAAVALGICRLPDGLNWKHICGAGILGGIGFTMSIFITNLAFQHDAALINASKIAILVASVTAGVLGFLWLKLFCDVKKSPGNVMQ